MFINSLMFDLLKVSQVCSSWARTVDKSSLKYTRSKVSFVTKLGSSFDRKPKCSCKIWITANIYWEIF